MDIYGADDADLRSFLLSLARDGRKRGWWQTYDLAPSHADLIGLEADASSLYTYEPLLVPGLLQTAAYARVAIGATSMTATPDQVTPLVEVRMARQSVLSRPTPLKLRAIIHEAALTARVPQGGVMKDQLQRLLELAEYPNITIQVLPIDAELTPGGLGGFTTLHFGQPGLDVTLLEHLDSNLYIEEASDVARYAEAYERLTAAALPFDRSLALIATKKEAHQ